MRRRDLLVIGAAVAVAVAIPPILRRWSRSFDFEPLPGLPGFRRLSSGQTSGGMDPFLGIGAPDAGAGPGEQIDICTALFGPEGFEADPLPMVIFTDYNCPFCSVFDRTIKNLVDEGAPVRLIWHELPLLGARSAAAARAALAAAKQDAYLPVHRDLMQRVLRPGPGALRELAQLHGLDADRLLADVNAPEIGAQLDASAALASRLGILGTPGAMVGRTLVQGNVSGDDLLRLIAIEQSEPFTACS